MTKKTVSAEPLKKSKVGIWLDSYNNFFSDFDPRIYSERDLSEDFLSQAKRITGDLKKDSFEVTFLIPKKERNETTERIIKERLRKYFKKVTEELEKEKKGYLIKGIVTVIIGVAIMFLASIIAYMGEETYANTLLLVVFDPAGWFAAWYGLDTIFYQAQEDNDDLRFYRKMSKVNLNFYSYE